VVKPIIRHYCRNF